MDPYAETDKLLERLAQLVEDAALSPPRIEAHAGLVPGTLTQLFSRRMELRYRHVLAVLDVLAVTPDAFFASLYPPAVATRAVAQRVRKEPVALPARGDVMSVYGFGIESVRGLRRRLERCELALSRLHGAGVLDHRRIRRG